MSPPRIRVTAHATDRFLRRSGMHISREQCSAVIRHAVETNEWLPDNNPHQSLVAMLVENRELYLVVIENEDHIAVVTVLTAAQVLSTRINGWAPGSRV